MKRLTAAAIAALCLLAAGCGSGSHQTVKPGPVVVAGHPCLQSNLTTQCILHSQPPPHAGLIPTTSHLSYGLDGWGPPPLATIRSNGYSFGVAYFSHDPSKDWTAAAVHAYHAAGKGTVGLWESSAQRSTEGPIAGAEDAMSYRAEASQVGDPNGPYRYAIDCDCSVASVAGYFQGADRADGGASNTDAYGGYDQINGLYARHLVGHLNWQTYAWSDGRWVAIAVAPLEQYLNGSAFDYDRALAVNYGQFPAPSSSDPFAILDRTRRHFRVRAFSPVWGAPYTVVASEHGTMATIRARGCHGAPRRAVCKSSKFHLTLLVGRLRTVGLREHPHYRIRGQGARQTIMARQLGRL